MFQSQSLTVVILGVVAVAPAVVWFPEAIRPLQHRIAYVTGNAKGCSYESAVHPIDEQVTQFGWKFWKEMSVERSDSGLVCWRTPFGKIWAPSGTSVAYLLAEQEAGVYDGGTIRVRPGDVVLDCGANVGTFTKRALASGARLVVAIEPSPLNVESLRRNLSVEIEQGKVILVAKALWHERTQLRFTVHENSALDTAVMKSRQENRASTREVLVQAIPLDAVVAELALDRVDLIKMDVEGAERNALLGGEQTLRRHEPRLAVATENGLDDIATVPEVVLGVLPTYRMTTGPCTRVGTWRMRPEVVYFEVLEN